MAIHVEEMEIDFVTNLEKFEKVSKEINFIKILKIFQFIIPIFGLLFLVLIFVFDVCVLGSTILNAAISMLIFLPSIYVIISVWLPIGMIIIERIRWKSTSKLPKEKTWSFNKEGIIIDEIYKKQKYNWDQITSVNDKKRNTIWFIFLDVFLGTIPKRVLDDEQIKQLQSILVFNLQNNKVKFKSEKIKK